MSGPNNQSRLPGSDARSRRAADALADPSVLIEDPLVIGRTGRITLGQMGARVGWIPRWDGSRWVAAPLFTPTGIKSRAYTAKLWELVLVDPSLAAVDITLPPSPSDGSQIIIKNHSDSTNVITAVPYGMNEIDEAVNSQIVIGRASMHLCAIAGGWITLCCGTVEATSGGPGAGVGEPMGLLLALTQA